MADVTEDTLVPNPADNLAPGHDPSVISGESQVSEDGVIATTVVKTTGEHIKTAASYVFPAASAGGSLAVVLSYFLKLPTEVAIALASLLIPIINMMLVWVDKKIGR